MPGQIYYAGTYPNGPHRNSQIVLAHIVGRYYEPTLWSRRYEASLSY